MSFCVFFFFCCSFYCLFGNEFRIFMRFFLSLLLIAYDWDCHLYFYFVVLGVAVNLIFSIFVWHKFLNNFDDERLIFIFNFHKSHAVFGHLFSFSNVLFSFLISLMHNFHPFVHNFYFFCCCQSSLHFKKKKKSVRRLSIDSRSTQWFENQIPLCLRSLIVMKSELLDRIRITHEKQK